MAFGLLALLSLFILSKCDLSALDGSKLCGQTIRVADNTNGFLKLDTRLQSQCLIKLQTNEGFSLAFAFKAVNVEDCSGSGIEVEAHDADLDRYEAVFSSFPHFCGKAFSSDKPVQVNPNQNTNGILLAITPANPGSTLAATFLFNAHKVGESPMWPDNAQTKDDQIKTVPQTTTSIQPSVTKSITSTGAASQPTRSSTSSTTPINNSTTSSLIAFSTATANFSIANRTCDCMLRYYVFPEKDDRYVPVFDINYIRVKPITLSGTSCYDSFRCHEYCRSHVKEYFPEGLDSKRFRFGNETVGDYICTNSIKEEVYQPKWIHLVAYQSSCPRSTATFVRTMDYQLCCRGRVNSYQRVSCAKALQGVDIFGK